MSDPTCVIFALKRERRAFHHHFPIKKTISRSPCWAALCGVGSPVLAVESGVGLHRMQATLDWLFKTQTPRLILSAGYAGALDDDLSVGDTILATEVLDGEGNRWRASWQVSSSNYAQGSLLTVSQFVATPTEKRNLAAKHGARIVDMESAVVARECASRNIPFGCLRTISDAVEPAISPRLVKLLAAGRVPLFRLSLAILRSPRLLPELVRLARHTRHASAQLGLALMDLLSTNESRAPLS